MKNNTDKSRSLTRVVPVLFGFFVMGFVDVVGTLTTYAKTQFQLSESLSGLIPSMIFVWFLLLGVPTALLMNRIGRKRTVQLSHIVTFTGMAIPFISFNFTTCLVACALLGIGNTLLQVSLNPLLTNVVGGDKLTSSLTAGQVVKALSAICAPLIAAFAANVLGGWQYIFPIYAGITLLSALWLLLTPIAETAPVDAASVGATFGLLRDPTVLVCFLGIIFIVGVDVGMNTVTPKLLIERAGMDDQTATFGISVYSMCRTVGALIGAALLVRMADMKYYKIHIGIAAAAVAGLFLAGGKIPILICVGIIGYSCSSIFSVIFSQAMKARPRNYNEISGLMITGVCGGAVIPPLMAFLSETLASQSGSLIIIAVCILYLVIFAALTRPLRPFRR